MPKRPSLVNQHLENISRAALDEHQAIIREYVRRKQGVYALYRRGKLYYVGLASNLRSRLTQHLKDKHGKSWDRFSVYLTDTDEHLRELEALILRVVNPPGNKQLGKFAKSENLKRRLSRDIREHYVRRLDDMLGLRVGKPRLKVKTGGKSKKAREKPDLVGVFARATTIRAVYKGYEYRARVRKDGTINYDGKLYNSLSHAARAVCKRGRNGWRFWTFKNATGEWVAIRELARK